MEHNCKRAVESSKEATYVDNTVAKVGRMPACVILARVRVQAAKRSDFRTDNNCDVSRPADRLFRACTLHRAQPDGQRARRTHRTTADTISSWRDCDRAGSWYHERRAAKRLPAQRVGDQRAAIEGIRSRTSGQAFRTGDRPTLRPAQQSTSAPQSNDGRRESVPTPWTRFRVHAIGFGRHRWSGNICLLNAGQPL